MYFDPLSGPGTSSLSPVHLLPEPTTRKRGRGGLAFLSTCKHSPTHWVGGMTDGRSAVWRGRKRLLMLSGARVTNGGTAMPEAPPMNTSDNQPPLPPLSAACFSPGCAVIYIIFSITLNMRDHPFLTPLCLTVTIHSSGQCIVAACAGEICVFDFQVWLANAMVEVGTLRW